MSSSGYLLGIRWYECFQRMPLGRMLRECLLEVKRREDRVRKGKI